MPPGRPNAESGGQHRLERRGSSFPTMSNDRAVVRARHARDAGTTYFRTTSTEQFAWRTIVFAFEPSR